MSFRTRLRSPTQHASSTDSGPGDADPDRAGDDDTGTGPVDTDPSPASPASASPATTDPATAGPPPTNPPPANSAPANSAPANEATASPAPADTASRDALNADAGAIDTADAEAASTTAEAGTVGDGVDAAEAPTGAGDAEPGDATEREPRRRRLAVSRVVTVLAGLMVFLALAGPADLDHRTLGVFLRIPVEALVAAAVVLALPARARRWVAGAAGLVFGLLAVVKVIDIGFYSVLDRPFDLVLDWSLLPDGLGVLRDSVGSVGALGAVAGTVLLVGGGLVLMTLAAIRLATVAARHRRAATRAIAAVTVLWVACAAFGVQLVTGVPVADRTTATLVHDRTVQVRAGLRDKEAFAAETAVDPFRDVPGNELLNGLRGKDVVVTFVESYGRSTVQDPRYAKQVGALLDAGTRRLAAAGYGSRSAYLTSSTSGGVSLLAHSTFLSGLWINSRQRYRTLVSSNRLTLSGAFQRAGWRTVSVEPAISEAWPEGKFFGYEQEYDNQNLGYRGPRFSYATMPDQYTFAAFQRAERGPNHRPLMAAVTLLSSHTPWTPTPTLIDWEDVGDGSIYHNPAIQHGDPPSAVWKDRNQIRAAYLLSIEYSLSTVISYVEKYGDDNLVMIFLGDHQPFSVVAGTGAGKDVPITIVARDKSVLDRISSWGWQDGLRPGRNAPVWRMDAFRNRFLTAFAR